MEQAAHIAMVERHEKDLYRGNGKPGLTTRMEVAEKRIGTIEEAVQRIMSNSTRLLFMIGAGILAIIGDVAVRLLVK